MTSNQSSVSISGIIQDMLSMGFNTSHCISELIDNPLGAGATIIHLHLLKKTNEIIIVDNGPGMDDDELVKSCILYNRKEASDDRQGRFGIGDKIAKVYFTQHNSSTITLSKVTSTALNQIKIDWKKAVEQNVLVNAASEASSENEKLWSTYAIVKEHGTLTKISVNPHIFAAMYVDLPKLTSYFETMYSADLSNKKTIEIYKDEKKYTLKPYNLLCCSTVPTGQYSIKIIEVWKCENIIRVYFVNGNHKKVFIDIDGKQNAKEYPPKKYVHLGDIIIESSLHFSKGNTTWKKDDGGHYIRRMTKIIERFPIESPGKGDFGEQMCIATARHCITFNSSLDTIFGLELNKSHINKDNIHKSVWERICEITKAFSKNIYALDKKAVAIEVAETPVVVTPPNVAVCSTVIDAIRSAADIEGTNLHNIVAPPPVVMEIGRASCRERVSSPV